jgi:hypothetical protein
LEWHACRTPTLEEACDTLMYDARNDAYIELTAALARRVILVVDEPSIDEKSLKWLRCIVRTAYSRT